MFALGVLIRAEGPTRFGLWMTVLALTTWLPLTTLGQQSALLTRLGPVALTDRGAAARVFSASLVILTGAAAIVVAALVLLGPFVPWADWLNAEGAPTRDVAAATALAALLVAALTFPANHAAFAIFAHQRGDLVHVVNIVSNVVAVGLVLLAARMGAPLWTLGALTLAGPGLGGLALWILGVASGLAPRPARAAVDRSHLRLLLTAGLHFVVIDATTLVLLRTPEVIVARLHGVEAVSPYGSVGRLSALMLALFQAVLLPLWPAIGDALARGDRAWVAAAARRSLGFVLVLWAVGALGILVAGPPFIAQWTGHPELADPALIRASIAQTLALALMSWVTVFLGGLSRQRAQVSANAIAAVLFLPLAVLLGRRLGPVGVALAQAAVLLLVAVPLGARAVYADLRGALAGRTP